MRVVGTIENFVICRTSRKYIVINKEGNYDSHSHFNSYNGAIICIKLIQDKILPKGRDFREALRRLVGEDELLTFREEKIRQKYKNNHRR